MPIHHRGLVRAAMACCAALFFCDAFANERAGFEGLLDPAATAQHPASSRALVMLGAKYVWGGSSATLGMDCSGFVYRSYLDGAGEALPRPAARMAKELIQVAPHQLRSGDLVFFNTRGARYSHVGIYLGGGLFAHAPRTGSPARLDQLSGYWMRVFDGARRVAPSPKKPLAHLARR